MKTDSSEMTGLTVNVLRSIDHDCTNNGVSANHERMVIYGLSVKNGPIDAEYNTDENAKLYIHENPRDPSILMATPSPDSDKMFQFGGNFIFTSDSRFPSRQPIKVHDRVEEKERRMNSTEIIEKTDQLHLEQKLLTHMSDMGIDVEQGLGHISTEISKIGKKYQDVLNVEQRARVFEGLIA